MSVCRERTTLLHFVGNHGNLKTLFTLSRELKFIFYLIMHECTLQVV